MATNTSEDDSGAASRAPIVSKQLKSEYIRSTTRRAARKTAPIHSQDLFESEVIGGRLWHSSCQSLASHEINTTIPDSFPSIDDYIATFDPLVLEEAREGLKSQWAENCTTGSFVWPVAITRVDLNVRGGWTDVLLQATEGQPEMLRACDQQGTLVVLTLGKPPQKNPADWLQSLLKGSNPNKRGNSIEIEANATVADKKDNRQKRQKLDEEGGATGSCGVVAIHASKTLHGQHPSPPGAARVFAGIAKRHGKAERGICIRIHPCCARHAHLDEGKSSICAQVLQYLRTHNREWYLIPAGTVISSNREYDAVHRVRDIDKNLMSRILHPMLLREDGMHVKDPGQRQKMWPQLLVKTSFVEYLKSQYDVSQLEAIELAACHLDGRNGVSTLPFILIQGPPGTGKTHTVRGVLNVWHLVSYQKYYDRIRSDILPSPEKGNTRRHSFQGRSLPQKPRLLVCTPSNAACDELLSRIMSDGFRDREGRVYWPNVVRVGSNEKVVAQQVKEVFIGFLVKKYTTITQQDWHHAVEKKKHELDLIVQSIETLEIGLERSSTEQDRQNVAMQLVNRHNRATSIDHDLALLGVARDFIFNQDDKSRREAQLEIEKLILSTAEMVFTTLSSTQRLQFQAAAKLAPFDTVLIDEAGQASEVAALQPLMFGAKRVVLVGDPQQLPATILSEAARAVALERSLFERLQKHDCPVCMLTVQYRMHPLIRQFPSQHFYQGRLQDADSIRDQPPEAFYQHSVLKPYMFFDISHGQEERRAGGGSLSNRAEAETAVALFYELHSFLKQRLETAFKDAAKQQLPPPVRQSAISVGVITPYREQRAVLQETFQQLLTPLLAREVQIDTIDSFQGRQLDVIILSCVRAGSTKGLGFVTDVRRMNVAITRAKRALWILGSASTLAANPEWKALIDDAQQRGLVLKDAHARTVFPSHPYWNIQEQKKGAPSKNKKKRDDTKAEQKQQVPKIPVSSKYPVLPTGR